MKAKQKKTLQAKVISDKMDKSIVVSISTSFKNEKYGKIIRQRKKFAVHDEGNIAKTGDTVLIEENRPISKSKSWVLVKIVD